MTVVLLADPDAAPSEDASTVLGLLDRGRPVWHREAACRGRVELLFPAMTVAAHVYPFARTLCRRCPVLEECRAEGDRLEEDQGENNIYGLRAGESPGERVSRRRR